MHRLLPIAPIAPLVVIGGLACGCRGPAGTPPPDTAASDGAAAGTTGVVRAFAGIAADTRHAVVEIEGWTCLGGGWLEQVACSPNTREHESLVVVEARPSEIHAALLMCGYQPGRPGSWTDEDGTVRYVPPEGDALDVWVRYDRDGVTVEHPVREWILDARGNPFPDDVAWIFGGSFLTESPEWMEPGEHYVADLTGSIVGLVTFGDEVLGLERVIADQESVHPAEWEIDRSRIPVEGTPLTLILRRFERPRPDAPR